MRKQRFFYFIGFYVLLLQNSVCAGGEDARGPGIESAVKQAKNAAQTSKLRSAYYTNKVKEQNDIIDDAEKRISELKAKTEAGYKIEQNEIVKQQARINEAKKALENEDPDHDKPKTKQLGTDIGDNKGLKQKLEESLFAEELAQNKAQELQKAHDAYTKAESNFDQSKQQVNEAEKKANEAANWNENTELEEVRMAKEAREKEHYGAMKNRDDAQKTLADKARDLADLSNQFDGGSEGKSVASNPEELKTSDYNANKAFAQSLTGGNSELQEINAVIEGQATANTKLHDQMSTLAKRANDPSLSGSINGRSNDGYQSNQGTAYIDGNPFEGRYFEDVHGGGRYFVPDSAYGGKGLDGYMAKRTTDLSGLHQLNGIIASGSATRVGSNIQFDGFYNGNQAYRNGMWNAPANGSQASRTNIPFSRSNSVSPMQASSRSPANTSTAQTQTPLRHFWSWIGQFFR